MLTLSDKEIKSEIIYGIKGVEVEIPYGFKINNVSMQFMTFAHDGIDKVSYGLTVHCAKFTYGCDFWHYKNHEDLINDYLLVYNYMNEKKEDV